MSRHLLAVSAEQTNGSFRTIGEALEAARTGAVIRVRPGRYAENLVITSGHDRRARTSGAAWRSARAGAPRCMLVADAVMLTDLTLRGGSEDLPVVDAAARSGRAWRAARSWRLRLDGRARPRQRVRSPCAAAASVNPDGAGIVDSAQRGSVIEDCRHRDTSAPPPWSWASEARSGGPRLRLRDARGNGVLANGEAQRLDRGLRDLRRPTSPPSRWRQNSTTRVLRTTDPRQRGRCLRHERLPPVLEDVHGHRTPRAPASCSPRRRPAAGLPHHAYQGQRSRRHRALPRAPSRTASSAARPSPRSGWWASSAPSLTHDGARLHRRSAAVLLDEESAPEFDRLEVTTSAGTAISIRDRRQPAAAPRADHLAPGGHGVEVIEDGRGRLEHCRSSRRRPHRAPDRRRAATPRPATRVISGAAEAGVSVGAVRPRHRPRLRDRRQRRRPASPSRRAAT